MNRLSLQLLSTLEEVSEPIDLAEMSLRTGNQDVEAIARNLALLTRAGWIDGRGRRYSITEKGMKILSEERGTVAISITDTFQKPSTMELGRHTDEPPQISSSAPVPTVSISENEHIVPLTEKERRLFASLAPRPRPW